MKMRNLMFLSLLISSSLYIGACDSKPATTDDTESLNDTEEVSADTVVGDYGALLTSQSSVDLTAFQSQMDSLGEFNGKIEVVISDVCQSKGCWMKAKLPDGRELRVTFKDYGFFVPKNAKGYTALIEGEAMKKLLDAETKDHYDKESSEANDSNSEEAASTEELTFVADGVTIKK